MTICEHARFYGAMTLKRFLKRAQKLVRMARVRALSPIRAFGPLRTHFQLPRNDVFSLRSSRDDGVEVRLVEPEVSFERALPFMPGELQVHFNFVKEQRGVFPATFVAELRRGRFWGHYGGAVFTADGRLVPELSKDVWGTSLHSAFLQTHLPKRRVLAGLTLSLVTPEAPSNYHHWMMDLIPRAGLVERAGYRLKDFDHVLINDRGLPYQRETLSRLGIDPSQLIRVDDQLHIEADRLVVPSMRHDNTKVSRAEMEFVRRLFLPEEAVPGTAHRRLYVSRRDASFRQVLNEHELMPLLREYGFEEVVMSSLSVAEQARIFSEAEVVMGPNGSALANLIFAHPSCLAIEFSAPGWVVGYNWMICANFGLLYTALVGKGPRPLAGSLPREIKEDITLDLDQVKLALEALGPRHGYGQASARDSRPARG